MMVNSTHFSSYHQDYENIPSKHLISKPFCIDPQLCKNIPSFKILSTESTFHTDYISDNDARASAGATTHLSCCG